MAKLTFCKMNLEGPSNRRYRFCSLWHLKYKYHAMIDKLLMTGQNHLQPRGNGYTCRKIQWHWQFIGRKELEEILWKTKCHLQKWYQETRFWRESDQSQRQGSESCRPVWFLLCTLLTAHEGPVICTNFEKLLCFI
jgi:hypothetical protein